MQYNFLDLIMFLSSKFKLVLLVYFDFGWCLLNISFRFFSLYLSVFAITNRFSSDPFSNNSFCYLLVVCHFVGMSDYIWLWVHSPALLFLGYLAIFSDENSLNYLKETFKLVKDADDGHFDAFVNLPIILVLASESGREEDANFLRQEGQDLADQ